MPRWWNREKKIKALWPIARIIAGRSWANKLAVIGMDRDDVESIALRAIVKAVDQYDPAHGFMLKNFAKLCAQRLVITDVDAAAAAHRRRASGNKYVAWTSLDAGMGDENQDDSHHDQKFADGIREMTDPSPSVEDQVLDPIAHQIKWDALLEGLTACERTIIEMRLDGFEQIEIADQFGWGRKRVDNGNLRAFRKIRKRAAELAESAD